jgi:SAM-dependent methyltransferase
LSATGRAEALLRGELRKPGAIDLRHGYLDVLGEDIDQDGLVQGLMRSDAVSRIYERWWRPAFGRIVKGAFGPGMVEEHRIARLLLGLRPGDGVLDVACGPGNFSRRFAAVVGDAGLVVGVDASRPMLERAMGEARAAGTTNLAFVHADAAVLPFRDEAFDAVACFAALNLFAEPFVALDHMRRVLTPGGRIAIFTSCRGRWPATRALESMLAAGSGVRMFGRHEITEALRERGFGGVRQRISGFTQFVGARLER